MNMGVETCVRAVCVKGPSVLVETGTARLPAEWVGRAPSFRKQVLMPQVDP